MASEVALNGVPFRFWPGGRVGVTTSLSIGATSTASPNMTCFRLLVAGSMGDGGRSSLSTGGARRLPPRWELPRSRFPALKLV